jgi:hypothetical protein
MIDAVLSLYWGNFKLDYFINSFGTFNNSVLGNIVRMVRGGIGLYLIYYFK